MLQVMKFCHFSETKDLYLRSDERKPSGKNNGKEKDEKSLSKDLTVSYVSIIFVPQNGLLAMPKIPPGVI